MTKADAPLRLIAENRKARFDYFIEQRYEAGLALQGWEVKAMRAGRAQLREAYVYLRGGEAFLIGAHLAPLPSASTHLTPDPVRTRKLLLKRSELQGLIGAVERRGYTLVPLELYWKSGRAKLALGLAKGKKQHDKRAAEKDRDWQRDKARLLRRG
ncbi:MAG TPA: SsrA-binding protein SmpB [Steroidobacteraceae bacterium]|nr:SsrA-binding protein SmpB [Steroidobacteraceae bacterium]